MKSFIQMFRPNIITKLGYDDLYFFRVIAILFSRIKPRRISQSGPRNTTDDIDILA
jgi:hypothetical protein